MDGRDSSRECLQREIPWGVGSGVSGSTNGRPNHANCILRSSSSKFPHDSWVTVTMTDMHVHCFCWPFLLRQRLLTERGSDHRVKGRNRKKKKKKEKGRINLKWLSQGALPPVLQRREARKGSTRWH
jgi:hypothetical protein